jgi:hypothetical protein
MERNSATPSTPSDPAAQSRTYSSKKLVNFINEEKTIFKPQNIVRPVQRAWNQDDTMDFYEEADALPPGGIRFVCVHARVLLHPCIMYACILSFQCLGMLLFSQQLLEHF